jgi:molecular chaperone GrpE (heat shock protein)
LAIKEQYGGDITNHYIIYICKVIHKSVWNWTRLHIFEENERIKSIIFQLEATFRNSKRWLSDLQSLQPRFMKLLEELNKGASEMQKKLQEYLYLHLKQLPPMDVSQAIDNVMSLTASSSNGALEEVKEMLKKNERISFKLIQEILAKLEDFSTHSNAKVAEDFREEITRLQNQNKSLLTDMLEFFDLLDLVRVNTITAGNQNWVKNIEVAINKALVSLDKYGLHEIKVEGEMFDSTIMEGIGTVSRQEIQKDVPKYTVYFVHQRGFKEKETGKLIRKAKVITVL